MTYRGCILGSCNYSDLVFCHYRHKSYEVRVIALPRKKSGSNIEIRERYLKCFSFFSPTKTTSSKDEMINPAFYLYKFLHSIIIDDLKRNTEEIIRINSRLFSSEDDLSALRKHLSVNPTSSILGMSEILSNLSNLFDYFM